MSILIGILTFVLVLVAIFLVLIVLAQKTKSDGGMGAAMGGGAAEATFGAEAGNVLTGLTIKGTVIFFVLSLGLYLLHIREQAVKKESQTLPTIDAPATLAPEAIAPETTPALTPPAVAPVVPTEPVAVPTESTPAPTTSP